MTEKRYPVREIDSLHRGIDRWFDDVFSWGPQSEFNPAVDIEEKPDHYLLSMDLPGVKKDDVKIEVNDHQLVISGERREERVEDEKNRYFMERSYGMFRRAFNIPTEIDPEKIEADFNDGVLRLAVPKTESVKPKTVKIGSRVGGLLNRLVGEKAGSRKAG